MLKPLNAKQIKEILIDKQLKEQRDLAKEGISSAIEDGHIVTVGNYDKDYINWKHFILAQIFRMGIKRFSDYTGWFEEELIEDLATDNDDERWLATATDYFRAMEGDD